MGGSYLTLKLIKIKMRGTELLKPSTLQKICSRSMYNHYKIGTREIVGHGGMSEIGYMDNVHYPFPAIRFKEDSAEIAELKAGDSLGQWKSILGSTLVLVSLSLILQYVGKTFMFPPEPATFTDEKQYMLLKRYIDERHGIYNGVSSKWDYDTNTWKK